MSFSLGSKLSEVAWSTSSHIFVYTHEDFGLPENWFLQLFTHNQILVSLLHSMTGKQRTGKKNGAKTSLRYYGFIISSPFRLSEQCFHRYEPSMNTLQTTHITFLPQSISQQSQHQKFTRGKIKTLSRWLRIVSNLSCYPPITPGLKRWLRHHQVCQWWKKINIAVTHNLITCHAKAHTHT